MRPDNGGFSLLEAIVALAILAAAGLALFTAMSQSIQMLGRAERSREIDSAMRNAIAVAQGIDPMKETRGEEPLAGFTLRWRVTPVEAPRPGATGTVRPGYYDVGLYRVRLELWRNGVLEHSGEVRRAGYRQMRMPATI